MVVKVYRLHSLLRQSDAIKNGTLTSLTLFNPLQIALRV